MEMLELIPWMGETLEELARVEEGENLSRELIMSKALVHI